MQVNDLILYLIATNRDYKVGDKFHEEKKISYNAYKDLDCKLFHNNYFSIVKIFKIKNFFRYLICCLVITK